MAATKILNTVRGMGIGYTKRIAHRIILRTSSKYYQQVATTKPHGFRNTSKIFYFLLFRVIYYHWNESLKNLASFGEIIYCMVEKFTMDNIGSNESSPDGIEAASAYM
ncbi:hypothetical protein KQX54_015814 [Cotesia glomerata]|uniref:Uncharacterized protein n=1 Tax=Cotesia glomerata TaxID=32391 RepID=A0AAV7I854_COTGL|nr:hypothetical protein KQX54_015814 [Cotesia glomerata]